MVDPPSGGKGLQRLMWNSTTSTGKKRSTHQESKRHDSSLWALGFVWQGPFNLRSVTHKCRHLEEACLSPLRGGVSISGMILSDGATYNSPKYHQDDHQIPASGDVPKRVGVCSAVTLFFLWWFPAEAGEPLECHPPLRIWQRLPGAPSDRPL